MACPLLLDAEWLENRSVHRPFVGTVLPSRGGCESEPCDSTEPRRTGTMEAPNFRVRSSFPCNEKLLIVVKLARKRPGRMWVVTFGTCGLACAQRRVD